MAEQMTVWEHEERERLHEEHERPFGSSHLEDGVGAVHHLNLNRTWRVVRQLICERPSESSHVEDGVGDAQRLDQWLRDSVWTLENILGRPSLCIARGVTKGRNPSAYTAYGETARRRRRTGKVRGWWTLAHQALQGFPLVMRCRGYDEYQSGWRGGEFDVLKTRRLGTTH
jgi:hypothetical protein